MTDAVLAAFSPDPARSVVVVDFDGTLAPIVDDPASAAPLPEAAGVLARLVRCVGTVAVVSGRPVGFLRDALPVAGVLLYGQYGVERFDGASASTMPEARAWIDAMRTAADTAERELPGLLVERKGSVAVGLHWRTRPELEVPGTELGQRLAIELGLRIEPGRCTVELRPPLDVDKGTALTALADGASAVLIVGDDRGDLAAFSAAVRLVAEGRLGHAVRAAVRSPESPSELLAAADVVVDGPAGVVGLLAALADRLEGAECPDRD